MPTLCSPLGYQPPTRSPPVWVGGERGVGRGGKEGRVGKAEREGEGKEGD